MRFFTKFILLLVMFILASSVVCAQTFESGDLSGSTVAGQNNSAKGYFSSAFGYTNIASGVSSSAFGANNEASENFSSAFGCENIASGLDGSAFGYKNIASDTGSSAFGVRNTASHQKSSAFGYENTASGLDSSAFGYGNTASNYDSSAFGYKNTASGRDSSAFGSSSHANADYSTAIGFQAVSKESYTVSFGHDEGDDDLINGVTYSDELNSRLVHVASGTANTDAVNLGQLNKTLENYQSKLGVEQLAAANSGITLDKVTTYDTYITSEGLTAGSRKITNVLAGTADTDAVNYGQFKLAYTDASFDSDKSQLTLTNANGDTNVIDIPTGSSLTEAQLAAVNSGITSDKIKAYDNKITTYDTYISSDGLTGGSKKITSVAAGTVDTDAVNYGQFKLAYTNATFDSQKGQLTLKTASGDTNVIDIPTGSGTDPQLKKTVEDNTNTIKKLLANFGFSAEKENKPSEGSITIGDSNEAGTTENTSMAIGSCNKVTGNNSIAIGYSTSGVGNTVSGNNSIAIGIGHQITGNNSGAFGDPSYIDTDNSFAVGNNDNISGTAGFIIGNNSSVSGANGMAFGSNSRITAENGVALGNNTEVSAKNAVAIGEGSKATEENTVSVGSDETKRRITNVDKAQNGTDAVNYDQMKDYIAENVGDVGEVIKLRQDVAKMDSRVSKVGASAAALAALKPMEFDPENKWSAGVGFGNLNGKSAAAVGIFYRPNRDVYYSLGGNVGGEENIVNAGISFSFGHRGTRLAVNQFASSDVVNSEVEAIRQENTELKDKVNTLETRMKRLERLIIKMSKEDK